MSDTQYRDPVRPLTADMMMWASDLDVVEVKRYPLPGGWECRIFDPDPRLDIKTMISGGQNVGPKNSDKVVYYEHVATLMHKKDGLWFVVFQMTMDALLADQKDPRMFPKWLMNDPVKKTELLYRYGVVKRPPREGDRLDDWLTDITEIVPNSEWVHDVLSWFLLKKSVIKESYVGQRD
jgi:hypothetical protein